MPAAPKIIEIPKVSIETDAELDRPWQVTVYNDPVNLMSYVTMVLMRVFGYPREKAEQMMLAVHLKGKCIVWTGEKERAELYLQQLHGYQLNAAVSQLS
ncbi:MAG: ATP-dependent Clp protease adapter ClpS [Verrucomicrobiales bacterium]